MLRPLLHLEYENKLFSGSVGTLYIERSFLMGKKQNFTYQLVVMAFLIALEIIFTRFLSFQLPMVRVGFGFLPVAVAAIMFGPIWAGVGYVIGDILGMILFPAAGYFPGFTLSAFVTGFLFGVVLHKKDITLKRTFVAAFIVLTVVSLGLDTLWLSITLGKGFFALLPARIIKALVMVVIEPLTITLVWNKVVSKVPSVKANIA